MIFVSYKINVGKSIFSYNGINIEFRSNEDVEMFLDLGFKKNFKIPFNYTLFVWELLKKFDNQF